MPKKKKTYEDYLNKSMKEKLLRAEILEERPELISIDEFKIKHRARLGQKTEKEWNALYDKAFADAAKEERIPREKMPSKKELHEGYLTNSDKTFRSMVALHGAEPVFVRDWINKVYTRDAFINYLPVMDKGSFSNDEFAVLTYMGTINPVVLGRNKDIDISNEAITWASDMCKVAVPRDVLVTNHGKEVFLPARRETERLIREYDNGNKEPLVNHITKGIRAIMIDTAGYEELAKMRGNFSANAKLLKETEKLLNLRPDLKNAVLDNLSDVEKKNVEILVNLGEMVDAKEIALQELTKVKEGKAEYSEEEILNYKKDIVAVDALDTTWVTESKEIKKNDDKRENHLHKLKNAEFVTDPDQLTAFVNSKAEEAKNYDFEPETKFVANPDNTARRVVTELKAREYQEKEDALESAQLALDTEFNQEFARMRKTGEKQDLDDYVDGRIRELEDGYQKRQITEYYFKERVKQLYELKDNPQAAMHVLPKFLDPNNDEKNIEFKKNIFKLENGSLFGNHLKDVVSFAKWKIEESKKNPDQEISVEEFDDDYWELMYQNELSRAAQKNPLPLPEGVEIPGLKTEEEKKEASQAHMDKEVSNIISEDSGIKPDKNRRGTTHLFPDRERKLAVNVLRVELPAIVIQMASLMKDKDSPSSQVVMNDIKEYFFKLVATPITMGIVERHGGKVPGGLRSHEFSRKMAEEPEFREIVGAMLEEVCEQYNQLHEGKPDISVFDVPKAERLIQMVDDNTILNAFGMQKRITGMEKQKAPKNAAEQVENPANKPESSVMKHVKNQLNQEVKKPEEKKPEGPVKK